MEAGQIGDAAMKVSPANHFVDAIALPLMLAGAVAFAGGFPGDDFRRAAEDYERKAADAVDHAAASAGKASGRYMQLAAIFREMAGIKRRAASLADVDRWDKITWDDYQALERRRDAVLDAIAVHELDAVQQAQPDLAYAQAAAEYRRHADDAETEAARARGAEQAIFQELAEVLDALATIEADAADAARNGGDIDWTLYEDLSERRQKLEAMIEAAR
jgi:hypothetical protein